MRYTLTVGVVFVTIFLVPILVYGILSRITGLQPLGDDPAAILAGVAASRAMAENGRGGKK